jgi:hypothetical protein
VNGLAGAASPGHEGTDNGLCCAVARRTARL